MRKPPSLIVRSIQILFLFLFALWLALSVHYMLHPRDPFSKWSDAFFIPWYAPVPQLAYPAFALLTRRSAWIGPWRIARMVQGIAVTLLILGFLLLVMSTPDVSGFSS